MHQVDSAAPTRRRPWYSVMLLALPLMLLATACNPVDTVADWFGLGDNEVATPEFEIQNGITIQASVQAPDGLDGSVVTVRLRCAGGSSLTETVTLHDTGQFATAVTTFDHTGWYGVDCVISQEIVQGVEVVRSIIQTLGGGDILRGQFFNL